MGFRIQPYKEGRPGYCGPASLHIVLKRYGVDVSEVALARLSGATTKEGVSCAGMVKAARKLGFKAFAREHSSIRDVRRYIQNETPVIVGWFSVNDSHFSVIAGIDRTNLKIADPETGTVAQVPIKDFQKVWFTFDGDHITRRGLHCRESIAIFL